MAGSNKVVDPDAVKAAMKRRQRSYKDTWLRTQHLICGSLAMALVAIAIGVVYYAPEKKPHEILVNDPKAIKKANGYKFFTAKASSNFNNWTLADVKKVFGNVFWSQLASKVPECKIVIRDSNDALPSYYDPRDKWASCFTEPYESGNCSSSWAIAVASSLSNRACIRNPGRLKGLRLSPQDILSCDRSSKGCRGGSIDGAFAHIGQTGIVSEKCFPFQGKSFPAVKCGLRCVSEVPMVLSEFCVVTDEDNLFREIHDNGPVVGVMTLRNDFLVYSGGIYRPIKTSSVLFDAKKQPLTHVVKIIGWGNDEGQSYWIVENNFGQDWGEAGYARIIRGSGVVIETQMFGGHVRTINKRKRATKDVQDEMDEEVHLQTD